MDDQKIAKELLHLASALLAEEKIATATAARKSEDATVEDAEAEEDPKFTEKVSGLRPAILKKLNKLRKRKVKQLTDKMSLTMTVEDLIDILNDLVAKVG